MALGIAPTGTCFKAPHYNPWAMKPANVGD
jgi:hypothetical protein